jgi:mRNA interferase RelE/StbE
MNIVFKSSFLNSIKKIKNKKLKLEIGEIILKCEEASGLPDISNLKKLKGFQSYYRIRTGDYRLGLKFEDDKLYFVEFDHRKNIYKKFP